MKRLVFASLTLFTIAWISGCVFDPSGIDHFCGDGRIDGSEECDGTNLGGATCESLGYGGGTLACTSECKLDVTSCTGGGECGNGVLDGTEQCDGTVFFGGSTCEERGYYGGTLACTEDCRVDESGCTGRCGDGVIQEGEEDCDGTNLEGATCETLGYDGGTLACTAGCRFDASSCTGGTTECGNGILEQGEECDDGTANSDTEPDACRTNCTNPICGDGVMDSGEQCDGSDLGGKTCQTELGVDGTLSCTWNCQLDTSGCSGEATGVCGDGVLDPGEECDGTLFRNPTTCEDLGYYGGTVRCGSDCRVDISECKAAGRCGDGILQGTEECDGTAFADSRTCQERGYYGGTVQCTNDCHEDISECVAAGRCGDGVVQSQYEECDGSDLGSATTCQDADPMYYPVAALSCDASCNYDESSCPYCGDGVRQANELCEKSNNPISYGDFHGNCSDDCQELVLVDQVDGNSGGDQIIRGSGFMNPFGPSYADGFAFAVMGDTNTGMFGEFIRGSSAGFVLTYDSNGSKLWHKFIEIKIGNNDFRPVTIWWGDVTGEGTIVACGKYDFDDDGDWDKIVRMYSRDGTIQYQDVGGGGVKDSNPRVTMYDNEIYLLSREDNTEGTLYRITYNTLLDQWDVEDSVDVDWDIARYVYNTYNNSYNVGQIWLRYLLVTNDSVYVAGSIWIDPDGSEDESYQAFIIKYQRDLSKYDWVALFGVAEYDTALQKAVNEEVRALAFDGSQLYAIGTYDCVPGHSSLFSTCQGNRDIFVMKVNASDGTIDTAGALLFGSSDNETPFDAAMSSSSIYFGGHTFGTDFEGIGGDGVSDGFVCGVDITSWTKRGCRLVNSGGSDSVRTMRLSHFAGHPVLLVAGAVDSALEPQYVKVSTDYDAYVMLILNDSL